MKITFDKEADAVYIYLKEAKVARTIEAASGILLDEDESGDVIGIELLRFSSRISPADSSALSLTVDVAK